MRKILLLISICVVMLGGNSVCHANDSDIYCSPNDSKNLSVLCQYTQDTLETEYDNASGRNAYFIPNSSTANTAGYTKYGRILNFYIDDNAISGNENFENILLEIEYKDAGYEHFYVTYDSHDGEKVYTDYIELYNSDEIKTARILLDDARFSNKCSKGAASTRENKNCDFTITVPRQSGGIGLYIYSVKVTKTGDYGGVKISSSNLIPGNIFFDGTNKSLNVSFENKRKENLTDMNVEYSIFDGKGNLYTQENKTISVDSGKTVSDNVNISDITKYGTYTLRIKITQDGLSVEKNIPFSVCVNASSDKENTRLGIGTHFSWGRDSESGLDIIKKLGISNIRDGYGWSKFETVEGVYSEPRAYKEYLANANKNGFSVLTAATYGNTIYGMSTQHYMPETDEQIQAYVNYVLEMLKLNHDKIDVVEVWNEPDAKTYNINAYERPEVYLKLLQSVSTAVRREYPDVKIAGPALSSATLSQKQDWLKSLLSASVTDEDGTEHFASEYFDIVTIHHYGLSYDRSIKNTVEELAQIKDIFAQNGCGDKEIYHTEFGASHLERKSANTMEKNDLFFQAEKLARYYLGLCGTNTGNRYYIYDFSDDSLADNKFGSNLGIVGSYTAEIPYCAKPAMIAVAHINKIIGTKEVTKYEIFELDSCTDSQNRHYGYEIRFGNLLDDSIVTALFTDSEDVEYTFHTDEENIEFFDLYGNRIDDDKISINGNEYTLTIGRSPVFVKACQTKSKIRVCDANGTVVLNGCFDKDGQCITAKVVNQDDEMVFIGETETNNNGSFEFRFEVPDKNGTYTALIGSQVLGDIYPFSFDASSLEKVIISVYSGTDRVITANEFCSGEPLDISVESFDSENVSFDMIINYYGDDNILLNSKIISSGEMTQDTNQFTTSIEDSSYPEAKKVNILVFDSIKNMHPLAKKIILQ